MKKQHAVGIDLGTTYSCIAHLDEHGSPISLPNSEGEYSTPSIVLFDGSEVVVGTEALRNSIMQPDRVVMYAKRHIGDNMKTWAFDSQFYTPVDISSLILKKLLENAEAQIGKISRAVITVPALFNDIQRQNTIEAGLKAGLDHVDIINEPVAAALCYVLGTEGLWFGEIADEQRIMVYDLGGGTFDLSVVKYLQDEVTVIASGGDLNLGGLDWNEKLVQAVCNKFDADFDSDPRLDISSMQALAIEVEQTKRSLSVRSQSSLTCQHGGHRKSYPITETRFRKLTRSLMERTTKITQDLLEKHKMGWAHIDAVLTVGGGTRMPMVRERLKAMSGTTLNSSLSPDQSIAQGAAYYAGMLLSNSDFARSILSSEATARLSKMKQQSVNARALGILARDDDDVRKPHYLLPENTLLPASITHHYGTVRENQQRVSLQIVESGAQPEDDCVPLGKCIIEELSSGLPEGSIIAVTISYDKQARVTVTAKDLQGGKEARTEIVRKENLTRSTSGSPLALQLDADSYSLQTPQQESGTVSSSILEQAPLVDQLGNDIQILATAQKQKKVVSAKQPSLATSANIEVKPKLKKKVRALSIDADLSDVPVLLCEQCGESLDRKGVCPEGHLQKGNLSSLESPSKPASKKKHSQQKRKKRKTLNQRPIPEPNRAKEEKQKEPSLPSADDIIDLKPGQTDSSLHRVRSLKKNRKRKSSTLKPEMQSRDEDDLNADDFWTLVD